MERDFTKINEQLRDHQAKWFEKIISPWVEKRDPNKSSALVKAIKKYFQDKGDYGFSQPFFTGVYSYEDATLPLIMFVGQETNGWGDYSEFDGIAEIKLSQEYVCEYAFNSIIDKKEKKRFPYIQKKYDYGIMERSDNSSNTEKECPLLYAKVRFWDLIRNVCEKSGREPNIVWTELDKIHYFYVEKNNKRCVKLWSEDEKELNEIVDDTNHRTMLELEIEIIKPDLVVFLTGPSYAQSMKDALHKYDLKKPNSDVFVREFSVLNTACLWTYHPNYLNRANLWDRVIDSIADKIRSI